MSLESLIEQAQEAQDYLSKNPGKLTREYSDATDKLLDARRRIVDFVLQHADTLIAWERQHALRLSPFDTDEG